MGKVLRVGPVADVGAAEEGRGNLTGDDAAGEGGSSATGAKLSASTRRGSREGWWAAGSMKLSMMASMALVSEVAREGVLLLA